MKESYIKVSWFAKNKSGLSEEEILNGYKTAKIGFDGSFCFKGQLFAVDRMRPSDTIIWLGKDQGNI